MSAKRELKGNWVNEPMCPKWVVNRYFWWCLSVVWFCAAFRCRVWFVFVFVWLFICCLLACLLAGVGGGLVVGWRWVGDGWWWVGGGLVVGWWWVGVGWWWVVWWVVWWVGGWLVGWWVGGWGWLVGWLVQDGRLLAKLFIFEHTWARQIKRNLLDYFQRADPIGNANEGHLGGVQVWGEGSYASRILLSSKQETFYGARGPICFRKAGKASAHWLVEMRLVASLMTGGQHAIFSVKKCRRFTRVMCDLCQIHA